MNLNVSSLKFAINPNKTAAVFPTRNGIVSYNFSNKKEERVGSRSSRFDCSCIKFGPRSNLCALASNQILEIYTITESEALMTTINKKAHNKLINDLDWNASDENLLITCSRNCDIAIWDRRKLSRITFQTSLGNINQVKWNPVNKYHFASTMESDVKIYDRRKLKECLLSFPSAHNGAIHSLSWSPFNSCDIMSAGEDDVIKIWNTKSSSNEGYKNVPGLMSAKFAETGVLFVINSDMCNEGNVLKIWEIGEETKELLPLPAHIYDFNFASEGNVMNYYVWTDKQTFHIVKKNFTSKVRASSEVNCEHFESNQHQSLRIDSPRPESKPFPSSVFHKIGCEDVLKVRSIDPEARTASFNVKYDLFYIDITYFNSKFSIDETNLPSENVNIIVNEMNKMLKDDKAGLQNSIKYLIKSVSSYKPNSFPAHRPLNIPYHRTSGARFSGTGQLVCFTCSQYVGKEEKGTTPRVLPQNHQGTISPPFNSIDLSDVRKKQSKSNFHVLIQDTSKCLYPSKQLGINYKIDRSNFKKCCQHNAMEASKINRKDLYSLWNLLSVIIDNTSFVNDEPKTRSPWACSPLGLQFVERYIEHYIKLNDVQTAAMLVYLFTPPQTNPECIEDYELSSSKGYSTLESQISGGQHGSLPISISRTSNLQDVVEAESPDDYHMMTQNQIENIDRRNNLCEFEADQHFKNLSVLRPERKVHYDELILCYAGILYRWQLYSKMCQFNQTSALNVKEDFEFTFSKNNYRLRCHICRLRVEGLVSSCASCGHGGHLHHMRQWFTEHVKCAAYFCGCLCLTDVDEDDANGTECNTQ